MRFASHRRNAFSLVELMIAIMILGLGMVMVATVFPVSLDLTRSTLQLNIADAAFEAAVATLKLRLPSEYQSFEPYPADTTTPVVLLPNVSQIELWNPPTDPTDIDPTTEGPARYPDIAASLPSGARITFLDFAFDWASGTYTSPQDLIATYWGSLAAGGRQNFLNSSRAYTESTLWDAELHGAFRGCCWVVPSQNLRAIDGALIPEERISNTETYSLPYIQNNGSTSPNWNTYKTPQPPAIHLVDRVYPPVNVEYDSANGVYFDRASGTVFDDSAPENNRYVRLANFTTRIAREKRYSWTAFARQAGQRYEDFVKNNHSFLCTIVLTYRGELSARYARQEQPADGPTFSQFNFTNNSATDFNGDVELMRFPRVDATYGPATDTVFPQPWLVRLETVNPSAGTVTCSGAIAKILPTDACFIVAQNSSTKLQAGTPVKVTKGLTDQALVSNQFYTLQITKSGGNSADNVPVWVFPPAINPDRKTFQGNSPVAGTAIREITPDWGK